MSKAELLVRAACALNGYRLEVRTWGSAAWGWVIEISTKDRSVYRHTWEKALEVVTDPNFTKASKRPKA